jgi:hypothetical protein
MSFNLSPLTWVSNILFASISRWYIVALFSQKMNNASVVLSYEKSDIQGFLASCNREEI